MKRIYAADHPIAIAHFLDAHGIAGNRSKEETGMELFEAKCLSDRRNVVRVMNATILPALAALGIIHEGLTFSYSQEEDKEALWQRTLALMPYYNMDDEWLRNTFGVQINGVMTS